MTTQPTPGPWEVTTGVPPSISYYVTHRERKNGKHLSYMVCAVGDTPAAEADARLIAAAPRMLEALKSLRSLSAFKAEANGAGPVYCWCDHEQPDDPNADHAPLCITLRALLRELHGDPS